MYWFIGKRRFLILTNNYGFEDMNVPMWKQPSTATSPVVIADDVWIGIRVIMKHYRSRIGGDARCGSAEDNIDILRRIHHGHAGTVKTNHGRMRILTNTPFSGANPPRVKSTKTAGNRRSSNGFRRFLCLEFQESLQRIRKIIINRRTRKLNCISVTFFGAIWLNPGEESAIIR